MDRVASLRLAAQQLRVSIFRSLPLSFRLAHAVVAAGYGEALGKYFGALFLKAGVQGMPDPGKRWKPDSPNAADTLPSGYYASFGHDILRKMKGKYSRSFGMEFIEDSLQEFIADRTLAKSLGLREGAAEHEAQGLVIRAVENFLIDKIRVLQNRKKIAPTGPMQRTDDEGEETEIDFNDPQSVDALQEEITRAQITQIKREIAKIVPWAPQWFDMLMDDYKDTEIIGDPMKGNPSLLAQQLGLDTPYLPSPSGKPMTIPMWSMNYKPKILDKIKDVYNRA